jgi:hypothetical protein
MKTYFCPTTKNITTVFFQLDRAIPCKHLRRGAAGEIQRLSPEISGKQIFFAFRFIFVPHIFPYFYLPEEITLCASFIAFVLPCLC